MKNSNEQDLPLPDILRDRLPVSYFLLTSFTKPDQTSPQLNLTGVSDFHNTIDYDLLPFYKPISNVL